jgi:hypothetical protein
VNPTARELRRLLQSVEPPVTVRLGSVVNLFAWVFAAGIVAGWVARHVFS